MVIRSLEIELKDQNHFCRLDQLEQRIQVFVEFVKIADTQEGWILKEVVGSEIPSVQYLIPKADAKLDFFRPSGLRRGCALKGESNALDLVVSFPYKIQIESVAWLFHDSAIGSKGKGGMVAFDLSKVSLRLDPK